MATISLYAGKINQMPGLIRGVRNSVAQLKTELGDLQKKASKVDVGVCDLSEVISSIQASSQTQEERASALESFRIDSENFVTETVHIDDNVAETVNQNKEDFYDKYDYLKPDCEKSGWEKFCDGCKAVGEWCKEHWKLIVTVVIVVVAVVLLCTGVGGILGAAALGAIMGAGIGGISGGLESMANGGSFWEGFESGAFSGAISGAIMGGALAGLGQLGATLGKGISCLSKLGKTIKVTAAVTKTLSTVMGGFDTLAMMDKMFGVFGGNLADFNAKLHESTAYNIFQIGVTALAAFTGGMTSTMSCFVAGTMVLTANGLIAIENIKTGDKVLSADPFSGATQEKRVIKTYQHEERDLVQLTIDNEIITTTYNHPFYVAEEGFVFANQLKIGTFLINKEGNRKIIERISYLKSSDPVRVYNLNIEDYHTYFVGRNSILVHNECNLPTENSKGFVKRVDNEDGSVTITKNIDGYGEVDITYTRAEDGNLYPRFEKYAHPDHPNPIKIEAKLTGDYKTDLSIIRQETGLKPAPGYTWHHLESGDSVLMVPSKIHSPGCGGFNHLGGASGLRSGSL